MGTRRANRNGERVTDERLVAMLSAGPLTTSQIARRADISTTRALQRLKKLNSVRGTEKALGKATVWERVTA